MKRALLLLSITLAAAFGLAQQPQQQQSDAQSAQTQPGAPTQSSAQPVQPQSGAQQAQSSAGGCIAVRPIGSHAARNIFLFGIAGAIISKQQYEVVDAVNYPAHVKEKYHGNDLQTIQGAGTKVVVLDKHYTPDDLHKACH